MRIENRLGTRNQNHKVMSPHVENSVRGASWEFRHPCPCSRSVQDLGHRKPDFSTPVQLKAGSIIVRDSTQAPDVQPLQSYGSLEKRPRKVPFQCCNCFCQRVMQRTWRLASKKRAAKAAGRCVRAPTASLLREPGHSASTEFALVPAAPMHKAEPLLRPTPLSSSRVLGLPSTSCGEALPGKLSREQCGDVPLCELLAKAWRGPIRMLTL
mmetsp:Transcript_84247/g.219248  ORF Transcript_84247/g.219248 Transcript_84247/m.219248 type:complete len:211 (+) Transcript_84247:45-677(+)